MWIGVRQRFRRFSTDLIVTKDQFDDGIEKQHEARRVLQREYYGVASDTPPGLIVGSWGKRTQRRPAVDLDLFFTVPITEFTRFQAREGNKQSALLQEVKTVLQDRWAQTDMRGDGQVVQVRFNSLTLEIVPAFQLRDGQFLIPDTNDGGNWRTADPLAEIEKIDTADRNSANNVRQLIRMLKCWRDHCNVPLDSFVIEMLVASFLPLYQYRLEDHYYYDWFVRDFFQHLVSRSGGYFPMPGTGRVVALGYDWLSRAESARDRALRACDYEQADSIVLAGEEWQKIFGARIPIHV